MVNISELLINVVIGNKRKVLSRGNAWAKMARGQVWVLLTHPSQMAHPRRRGRILRYAQDRL
jgi:hypothetical protein